MVAGRRNLDDEHVELVDTRVETLVFGDEALVSVLGELDRFNVGLLTAALAELPTVSRVVIDLQDVAFLDCAALSRIEAAAREFAAAGRILRLDHATGVVRRLIDVMRLDDLRVR